MSTCSTLGSYVRNIYEQWLPSSPKLDTIIQHLKNDSYAVFHIQNKEEPSRLVLLKLTPLEKGGFFLSKYEQEKSLHGIEIHPDEDLDTAIGKYIASYTSSIGEVSASSLQSSKELIKQAKKDGLIVTNKKKASYCISRSLEGLSGSIKATGTHKDLLLETYIQGSQLLYKKEDSFLGQAGKAFLLYLNFSGLLNLSVPTVSAPTISNALSLATSSYPSIATTSTIGLTLLMATPAFADHNIEKKSADNNHRILFIAPTLAPVFAPTRIPTHSPSQLPTTTVPTQTPTTAAPTQVPTDTPSQLPTTTVPTQTPTTAAPTNQPTDLPTTIAPSQMPTDIPTQLPTTSTPTVAPSTAQPTSTAPSQMPTTVTPTQTPSTVSPTINPTAAPSTAPPTTAAPTNSPSTQPTTTVPTQAPSTNLPTSNPTVAPSTASPTTAAPTNSLSTQPTTAIPTQAPSTVSSTINPTAAPSTAVPTTALPTNSLSTQPTTATPTQAPSTVSPTINLTVAPSTAVPTTAVPTNSPSTQPTTATPTQAPSTVSPTINLTVAPSTAVPTTALPTTALTKQPSFRPTSKSPSQTPITRSPSVSYASYMPSLSTSWPTSSPTTKAVLSFNNHLALTIGSVVGGVFALIGLMLCWRKGYCHSWRWSVSKSKVIQVQPINQKDTSSSQNTDNHQPSTTNTPPNTRTVTPEEIIGDQKSGNNLLVKVQGNTSSQLRRDTGDTSILTSTPSTPEKDHEETRQPTETSSVKNYYGKDWGNRQVVPLEIINLEDDISDMFQFDGIV